MKLKLIGSTFAALIVYMLTALIGLFQFNPLSSILVSGVKFALMAFVFIFTISYIMEILNKQAQKTVSKNKDENKEKQNPPGKAVRAYDENNANQNQTNTQKKAAVNEKPKESSSKKKDDREAEDDFSKIKPPVIEYEKNN